MNINIIAYFCTNAALHISEDSLILSSRTNSLEEYNMAQILF